MADWPCELRAGESDRPIDAGNAHLLRHEGAAAALRHLPRSREGLGGRHGIITYNPGMARDQAGLVATFAHELGHYLMATAAGDSAGRLGAARAPHRSRRRLSRLRHLPRQQRAQLQPSFRRAGEMRLVSRSDPGLSERGRAGHRDRDLPAARRARADGGRALAQGLSAQATSSNADRALAKLAPDMAAAVAADRPRRLSAAPRC